MPTNDFKPFATAGGANVSTQAEYLALAALSTGWQSGKASSKEVNKAVRQATFIAAAVAQFIADKGGVDVLDDGDLAGFGTKLITAMNKTSQPLDATLTALAALVGASNKLPYFNGADTAALTDLTQVGRDIIGKADVAAVLTYLGLGALQSSYVDTVGKLSVNGGWGLGITADKMTATMAALNVSRFDYFDPASNLGPYPGQWSGGISFANSGATGWQIVGASLGAKPDFSARIKTGQSTFSDWVQFYHTGHKPTADETGALAKVSNLSDVNDKSAARTNLGLGSAATKAIGAGSGQVPDMASFASGPGWQMLPGGTIIQWGISASGQIGDPLIVNLPIAFTQYQNAQIVATYDNSASTNAPYTFAAQPISNTQFKLLNSTQSSAVIFARWIAIGK